jgi:hypothetical protein
MTGVEAVQKELQRLGSGELRVAQAKGLNDTAFHIRRAMVRELGSVFDRPTPFIARSPKFVSATPDNLSVRILPTVDARNLPSKGGKVGVDPQQVLQAQEFGGRRALKKSEAVMRRSGILPSGYQTALPADPYPGSDDGRGNFRAGFLVRLLSYLQAFGQQGYSANITDRSAKRRKDIAEFSNIRSRRQVRLMDGAEFIVSQGRGAGRRQGLAAGIWARTGKVIKPVVIFTQPGNYTPRLSMERIAQQSGAEDYLAKRLRFRIREAAGV